MSSISLHTVLLMSTCLQSLCCTLAAHLVCLSVFCTCAASPTRLCCVPAGYMALVCVPGLLLAYRMYALYKQEGGLPLPSPTKTFAGMLGVLMPRNPPAAAYSLLTLAFAGMAAMCLSAAPGQAMKLYPGLHGESSSGNTVGVVAGVSMLCEMTLWY